MAKEKASVTHKVLSILGALLCVILIPILIINVTLIVKSYTNKDEVPGIGGIFPLIVLTDSMEPTIHGGDLIISKTVAAEDVKVGDVISFFDPAGNGSSILTHRVVEVIEENGELSFRTRGDANNTDDRDAVPAKSLIGRYSKRIPGMGRVAMFMQSTTGLIVCVLLPIILLVAYDILRRRSYDKKKQNDNDALLAELEALRAEKAQKELAEKAESPAEDEQAGDEAEK